MRNGKLRKVGIALELLWKMDRWLLLHTLIVSVIKSVNPFVGIFLSAYVLDGLQAGKETRRLLLISALCVAAVFLLGVLQAYFQKRREVHTSMCGKTFDTLMSMKTITMDYPLLDSPAVGDIRTRIQHDNNWGAGFYSLVWQLPLLLGSVITALISLGTLIPLFLNSRIFADVSVITLLVLFGAVVMIQIWFNAENHKKLFRLLDDDTLDKSYLGYFLWKDQDYHYGKDIRIYGAKPLISSKIEGDVRVKEKWTGKLVANNMGAGFVGNFSAGFLQVAAYIFVVVRAAAGALSVGSVVKYAGIIYRFSQAIAYVFLIFDEYAVSSDRQSSTLEYLNMEDILPKGSLPVEKRAFCEGGDNDYEIEFRDVSFRYPGSDSYALRHVDMKFDVGRRLAVVGRNGSGKTTFIKLLCRLYDPTEGEILLNGINIKKYDYDEYLRIFSVVFQDFKLFSFGLGQNVAASVEPDEERVRACLTKAGFGEALNKMPEGIQTCLYKDFEESGVEISGGEAQKIALARALYKDAPFIILDEPTAALDPVAEYEIYSKFNEIVEDKTAIYISHRLSSCRFCDEIAVFEKGEIIQRGKHEELVLDEDGTYYELWHAQARYYK